MKLRRCGFIAEDVYLAYRLLDKETDAFGGVCIEICKRRLIALILGCLEPELMKLAVEIGLRLSQELNPIAVYYWFVQAAPVVSPLVNNPQLKSVAPFVIIFFATPSVSIFSQFFQMKFAETCQHDGFWCGALENFDVCQFVDGLICNRCRRSRFVKACFGFESRRIQGMCGCLACDTTWFAAWCFSPTFYPAISPTLKVPRLPTKLRKRRVRGNDHR